MINQIQIDSNRAINFISTKLDKVNNCREFAANTVASLDKIIDSVTRVSGSIPQVANANEDLKKFAISLQDLINLFELGELDDRNVKMLYARY